LVLLTAGTSASVMEIFIASFTPSPPQFFAISGGKRDEKVVQFQR
jgi:hypothetical protein